MDDALQIGFVVQHNLGYASFPGHIEIIGNAVCKGDITITVEKYLHVLGDPDEIPSAESMVQTLLYSYNASVRGHRTFLRYDNCHPHNGHADAHHRHVADWRTGDEFENSPEWMGIAGWPHLSEYIDEVHDWYLEHQNDLPNPQATPPLRKHLSRLFGGHQSDD